MVAVQAMRPTVLITGSTDGIGLTTAKNMAKLGYHVIVHGRDETRIHRACDAIRAFVDHDRHQDYVSTKANKNKNKEKEDGVNDGVVVIESEKADLSTVRGCELLASGVTKICRDKNLHLSVLMNNAGVYSEDLVITSDGTELTFAVNVLAPFVLTSLLLPELLRNHCDITTTNSTISGTGSRSSRIVIASSISQCRSMRDWNDLHYQKRAYSAHGAYSESKLCDAMLAKEFAERLQGTGYGSDQVTCNSLDPGTVNTKMLLAGWGPCGIDVEDALDETYLCSSPEVEGITGSYFRWRSESRSDYPAQERHKLWNILSDLAPSSTDMWKFDWR